MSNELSLRNTESKAAHRRVCFPVVQRRQRPAQDRRSQRLDRLSLSVNDRKDLCEPPPRRGVGRVVRPFDLVGRQFAVDGLSEVLEPGRVEEVGLVELGVDERRDREEKLNGVRDRGRGREGLLGFRSTRMDRGPEGMSPFRGRACVYIPLSGHCHLREKGPSCAPSKESSAPASPASADSMRSTRLSAALRMRTIESAAARRSR